MQITQNTIGNTSGTQAAPQAAHGPAASSNRPATQPAFHGVAFHGVEDTATLSTAASLLSRALNGDAAQPGKVEQITAALVNGTYTIDSHQLASTLIESMRQGAE